MIAFALDAAAVARAAPPFSFVLGTANPRNSDRWRLRDGACRTLGHAPTRAGARAAVLALYGQGASA